MDLFFRGATGAPTAGTRGVQPPPQRTRIQFGNSTDRDEFARSDQLVLAQRKQRVAAAAAEMHADRDIVSYQARIFTEANGREFLENTFGGGSQPEITGRAFLEFLLAPDALDLQNPPTAESARQIDFNRLGKSDGDVRRFFESLADQDDAGNARSFPTFIYTDMLKLASDRGLLYTIYDPQTEQTYYGIPPEVRNALDLHAEPVETVQAETAPVATDTGFADSLKRLAAAVEGLDPFDELFDYAAQLVVNASRRGLAGDEDFSAEFKRKVAALNPLPSDSLSVLEDLAETAEAGDYSKDIQDAVRAVREQAAAAELYTPTGIG